MELRTVSRTIPARPFVDAPDIHPGDGFIGRRREHVERQVLLFVAASARVVERPDRDLVRFFLADVDERPGGKTRLSAIVSAPPSYGSLPRRIPCLYAGSPTRVKRRHARSRCLSRFAGSGRPATLPAHSAKACNLMERELRILVDRSGTPAGASGVNSPSDGFDVQTKPDRSPVTTVDLEVNRILHDMQRREFPGDGWLSEESPDDPSRLTEGARVDCRPHRRHKGLRESDAGVLHLCRAGRTRRPVVAAIFNPSTDELFTAVRGGGLFLNGARVDRAAPLRIRPVVMVNAWEFRSGRWSTLAETVGAAPCTRSPMH